MARSTRIGLLDIRDEIAGIQRLTDGATLDAFASSWAMKRAVQHALLIIAEAAKSIPSDMKASRPDVPWQKIHGLGNMLRHEYRRIDDTILWSVVTDQLRPLDAAIAAMIDGLED